MTSPPSITALTVKPSWCRNLPRNDAILRDIDQTPGQVTRVRGLQRRIGQPFRAPCVELKVLEHGQAFLEVRYDRRLDDFARRLGHQTPHTGQLLDLRGGTTRTGMRHHVHRVDLLAGLTWTSPAIISSATSSVQRDQTSTTLLYFSPWVIKPSRYCCSNSLTVVWPRRPNQPWRPG